MRRLIAPSFETSLASHRSTLGRDWLIFALPPAEIAVHPAEGTSGHELYLMSDDLAADMAALKVKGVQCSRIEEVRWGLLTRIRRRTKALPGEASVPPGAR